MINGRTRLHVVANGTMTGQRYIDEVLLPHVRLFRGAVGDKFVFMDDNATCYRTLAVQDCLDSEGIQRLVWPARSPVLNSIENVWDALGGKLLVETILRQNKNTLIRALTEEWDKLPQQLLDNVVQRLDFTPREFVYHTVRRLRGKFSKVQEILKTQREKTMEEILQMLREEETTFNLPIKTRIDWINAEAFYSRRNNEKPKKNHFAIFPENQITWQIIVTIKEELSKYKPKEYNRKKQFV
ncbi:transposable element Tc3 transposase [Trichonephila clavipes]|nr:transposable element Tc3 transposase [Trichonephila clavipes]